MESTKQLSVLLLDDDPEMHNLFQIIMEHYHIQLATALDAQSGLAYLAQHSPDVIVVDLILPDSDGYRVLAAIRENATTRNSKVILTTTYYKSDAKPDILERGFDGFLAKPLSPTNLIPYIESIVNGS